MRFKMSFCLVLCLFLINGTNGESGKYDYHNQAEYCRATECNFLYYLGSGPLNLIESVFEVCDYGAKGGQGFLTLEEIKDHTCIDHLTTLFGMQVANVDKDFKALDENNDGLVSKQESFNALKNLARAGKNEFEILRSNGLDINKLNIIGVALNHYEHDLHIVRNWNKFIEWMRDFMNEALGGDWSCSIYRCSYRRDGRVYGSNAKYVEFYTMQDSEHIDYWQESDHLLVICFA